MSVENREFLYREITKLVLEDLGFRDEPCSIWCGENGLDNWYVAIQIGNKHIRASGCNDVRFQRGRLIRNTIRPLSEPCLLRISNWNYVVLSLVTSLVDGLTCETSIST